ncbi:heterokaryon incompatibility protein-domain-containing protein [Aspergillus lucknowensis]|uniref:Heterokaryon incompatibility protein-domain-containing protein n=1 Tax=Aspergillus lucknowensis TaxID=176173 RepID=A0ABR4LC20_9EURO
MALLLERVPWLYFPCLPLLGASPDREQTTLLNVSKVSKKGYVQFCARLTREIFHWEGPESGEWFGKRFLFHPSLTSLQQSARDGCPFCLFVWKQLTISTTTLPQFSPVFLIASLQHRMHIEKQEPDPGISEMHARPSTDFDVCIEPFEGKLQPLHGSTASVETYEQLQFWLNQCTNHHSPCNIGLDDHYLSTRLIDLTHWDSIRTLHIVNSIDIRGPRPPYMALSHRWNGSITAAASTASENIRTRLRSLNVDEMPLAFVHAVEVAQQLCVDYLWIDSICILQDSKDDWIRKSSIMGRVYSNAYCTIAAQMPLAVSSSGLFGSQDVENNSLDFSCCSEDGQFKTVRAVKTQPLWVDEFGRGVLQDRGWCLQELELSPRVLHYTPSHVLWECRTLKATQGWPTINVSDQLDLRGQARMVDRIHNQSIDKIYDSWLYTVAAYTSRQLTKFEDRLPALGGLARVMKRYAHSKYVAGIWAGDIRRSLGWKTGNRNAQLAWTPVGKDWRTTVTSRHGSYIAPTWSWVSVSGPIRHQRATMAEVDIGAQGAARLDSYNIQLATSDLFGQIGSAELFITAQVLDAVVSHDRKHIHDPYQNQTYGRWYGGIEFDVPAESESLMVVQCILLFFSPCPVRCRLSNGAG